MDWFTIAFTIAGFIVSIIPLVAYSISRLSKIELKVDTLWDYIMRRALSETIIKGLGTTNSPLVITEETRSWYASMIPELQSFYKKVGLYLTDRELFMEIERRFGERILKEVCIPRGLFAGSCILVAMEIAKEVRCAGENSNGK